jgi:glycosyltransferase involved in cell wall biosynthesis
MRNLYTIQLQTYDNIEIVISDDKSSDDTVAKIIDLQSDYRFPIILNVNETNAGYDRNYRKSIELATGEYAMVLGNDDTLNNIDAVSDIVRFLKTNHYPDIGYCNYVEEAEPQNIFERAKSTAVHGSGFEIALQYYSGFSFVAGIIYKTEAFNRYNTSKHDGSIYAQMYLGLLMIASGCTFFTIAKPFILKDISDSKGLKAMETYKSKLAKSWKSYEKGDGGLPSVSHVLISAMEDASDQKDKTIAYKILRRIYGVTFPYWIIQYKAYGSIYASLGLIHGLYPPSTINWIKIDFIGKVRLMALYITMSIAGIILPISIFKRYEKKFRRYTRMNIV